MDMEMIRLNNLDEQKKNSLVFFIENPINRIEYRIYMGINKWFQMKKKSLVSAQNEKKTSSFINQQKKNQTKLKPKSSGGLYNTVKKIGGTS